MFFLIIGLILFLGIHSTRIFADSARSRMIEGMGANSWKGLYTVVSIIGLGLIIWGFGQARSAPVFLWAPPAFMKHIGSVLLLVAFVFLAAAYVPGNSIKAKLGHPMILGVKTWAIAHLLMSGKLASLVLFGSFLVWAVLCFRSCKVRDRLNGFSRPKGSMAMTLVTVGVGVGIWILFALWAHRVLIGIKPFGV